MACALRSAPEGGRATLYGRAPRAAFRRVGSSHHRYTGDIRQCDEPARRQPCITSRTHVFHAWLKLRRRIGRWSATGLGRDALLRFVYKVLHESTRPVHVETRTPNPNNGVDGKPLIGMHRTRCVRFAVAILAVPRVPALPLNTGVGFFEEHPEDRVQPGRHPVGDQGK